MTKDDRRKYNNAAAKAADLKRWLEDVAWEELLSPALRAQREIYVARMVQIALGGQYKDGKGPTVEQLAGRVAGIEFLFDFFHRVLKDGQRADQALRDLEVRGVRQ